MAFCFFVENDTKKTILSADIMFPKTEQWAITTSI